MQKTRILPMVALRGLVIYPYMVLHFDIGRKKSVAALESCIEEGSDIFLTAQKDIAVEDPKHDEIYQVGAVAKVKQVLKMPGNSIRVLVEGLHRGKIVEYVQDEPYLKVNIEEFNEPEAGGEFDELKEAYVRKIGDLFEDFSRYSANISPETMLAIEEVTQPGKFADLVAANVVVNLDDKQKVMDAIGELDRLRVVMEMLIKETNILKLDKKISIAVKKQIDKSQREYFLREQIKVIQNELGESENDAAEIDALRKKIKKLPLPKETREKAQKEITRLSRMAAGSPEATVSRNYIDWIAELPWGVYTKDNLDLDHAREALDEGHYGLEKVKDRIIEFLAVRKLKNDTKGSIICLAGPPGVGKTSIAKSIAKAVNKKFVRMSLGGVHDEAEIRGHRRTYIGAVPGRIISSIKQAGSMNPLFLLDEIDKMSHDFRGDPASAMLEVLDPEINNTFADNYLDSPFDLSQVMFITTANDISSIPAPLYDRMEIIEVSSYTDVEKLNIAKRHLIKKQAEEHGLAQENVVISDSVIMDIIHLYTAESGVRNLERQIGAIMRKAATQIVRNDDVKKVVVTKRNLKNFLGLPKRSESDVPKEDTIGVVTGLAWTAVGGTTLPVEVCTMEGKGNIQLTGNLGNVMKESAMTGLSLVRSMKDKLGITTDFEKTDIHIHVPEGAIPKDGPSAGVTMVTAMTSALTGIPVRHDIAMTGEITLTGRALKIGGLREKSLAAVRAGITNIIIPADNKGDIEEIPESVRKKITFFYASKIEDVLEKALAKEKVNDN